ncbi:MAG: ABC transporter permease [Proteobacteria bacterium]|jgi:ABC-type multidrug transport system permease subunit|nr:ABC transporter permease [Pseudomonadota bacterium]
MAEPRTPRLFPLWELTKARILEFVRDPSAIFWVFGFPVLLAIVLGVAFRGQEPERPRVAVTGPGAADAARRLEADGRVEVVDLADRAAVDALRLGRIDLLVEAGRREARAPEISYRFDPTRPGARGAQMLVDDSIQRSFGRADVVKASESHVFEPGGRYIDFLLPGLIGLNVMGSCLWGMGYSIVDARRRKLLKRFAVTPMRRAHFQLSFMLSRLVFLAAEVAVIVTFGWLAFGVKVHGSIAALGAVALLSTFAFSGLALLIAARTESTEVASGWMNFVQMPMWLFSGSFFDYSRFPDAAQPFIRALPLTAFNDAARAIVNEGASIVAVAPQVLILCAWAAVSFVIAMRIFRWQ